MKNWRMLSVVCVAIVAACGGSESDEGLVARAGDQLFTVDEAVELLVDQENLPNQTDVVRALSDIWTDYTLLARAVARDSTLKQLDLEPLVRQQLEQQMIAAHVDSVIQVDTAITEDELRNAYESEAPDAELHARHILLGFPNQPTQAQRDSVKAEAEELRRRAAAGEDFAALARRYSQDPATAPQGGDLGSITRGQTVKPFEDAAFALQPGEISPVVETPYGYHVIRLESKEAPGFDSMRDAFRARLQNQRYLSAESAYVASVEERRAPKTAESAFGVLKELAREPGTQLSARAAARPLVSFEGGELTVGEFRTFVQGQQPQLRQSIQGATDEQLGNFLNGLAQREMLVAEARSAGLEPPRQRVDSLVASTRAQILAAADEIGLRHLDQAPGEPVGPAITRAVDRALADILSGADNVVPLGPIAYQLRSRVSTAVYEAGMGQVVLKIGQVRAGRAPAPTDSSGEPQPGDTAGSGAGTR